MHGEKVIVIGLIHIAAGNGCATLTSRQRAQAQIKRANHERTHSLGRRRHPHHRCSGSAGAQTTVLTGDTDSPSPMRGDRLHPCKE